MLRLAAPTAVAALSAVAHHAHRRRRDNTVVSSCDEAPPKTTTTTTTTTTPPGDAHESRFCVLERQHAGAPLVRISFKELAADLAAPALRLVLFGEVHDDAVAQALQRRLYPPASRGGCGIREEEEEEDFDDADEVEERRPARAARALTTKKKPWALALEFVETDRRAAARAFLEAADDDPVEALFATSAEARRYGPLAVAAKRSANAILAANAPKRLVDKVARRGPESLDGLDPADRDLLPPLPHAAPSEAYARRLRRVFTRFNHKTDDDGRSRGAAPDADDDDDFKQTQLRHARLVAAQTLRDATMAHAICEHLTARPRDGVFFVGGKFHVEFFLGVVDHVEHLLPGGLDRDEFRLIVAAPLNPDDFDRHEARGWTDVCRDPKLTAVADFLVFTRADAT